MTWRPPEDERSLRNKVEDAMQTVVENLAHLGAKDAHIASLFRGAREFQEEVYAVLHPGASVPEWMERREDMES